MNTWGGAGDFQNKTGNVRVERLMGDHKGSLKNGDKAGIREQMQQIITTVTATEKLKHTTDYRSRPSRLLDLLEDPNSCVPH